MHKLFNNYIEKILQTYNYINILEIRVYKGVTTIKILEWHLKEILNLVTFLRIEDVSRIKKILK